jgi:hypothetical protein
MALVDSSSAADKRFVSHTDNLHFALSTMPLYTSLQKPIVTSTGYTAKTAISSGSCGFETVPGLGQFRTFQSFCHDSGTILPPTVDRILLDRKDFEPNLITPRGGSCRGKQMMRKFLKYVVALLSFRHNPTSRGNLIGMYLGESNSTRSRKPNRDRA